MPRRLTPPRPGLLAAALVLCTLHPHAEDVTESRLKAAFVLKVPQFVEWPRPAVEGRPTIDICVAGPDPFVSELHELLTSDDDLAGRPLAVRQIERSQELADCHLLVLNGSSNGRKALLAAASNRPILTVGDTATFLDDGGIVEMRMVDGRVRFEIDEGAARRVGLRISSQFLRLALAVRGGPA